MAKALAEQGYQITLLDLKKEAANQIVNEINVDLPSFFKLKANSFFIVVNKITFKSQIKKAGLFNYFR